MNFLKQHIVATSRGIKKIVENQDLSYEFIRILVIQFNDKSLEKHWLADPVIRDP